MNKKLLIVGIVAVIAILVFASLAFSASKNKGEYNYSLSNTTSFTYEGAFGTTTKNADAGKEFVVATITLKNLNHSDGISTNPFNFKLNVGGVMYSHDLATYSHPGYKSTVSLGVGSQYTFTVVFQVPLGSTGATLVWDGIPSKVVYNGALV